MRHAVLVTDGEQRATLALVRSLGGTGAAVFVCSSRGDSLAGASRHCRGHAQVPDALASSHAFVDAIADLVSRWSIDVLIPVTEAALLALLPARDRFPGVLLPFTEPEGFRAISDKERVLSVAAEVGIAVPQQWVVRSPDEDDALRERDLAFPLVVKPSRSVAESNGSRLKLSVGHAANPTELEERLEALPPAAYPILLQQRVVGPGVGVFILLWDDEPWAVFAHRRLREKPPAGGVSVYRESIAADPSLVDQTVLLLRRFAWRGVAMVEYKIDAATGMPYLMEINGRFWGSLQLALDSGVDFPALLLTAASGAPRPPAPSYRLGLRSRWWWGDVDHILLRLRRSPRELALPPDSPSRARALRDFLVLWRPGDRNEVLRLSDPVPFLRETADWLRGR